MLEEYTIREISLRYWNEKEDLRAFLARHMLTYEDDIETAFGIYRCEGSLAGCGCAAGNLLKCFAVDEELRGQNALGVLTSSLIQDRFVKGLYDLFLITHTYNRTLFENCGFTTVAATENIVMLENRTDGLQKFAKSFWQEGDEERTIGAIVMNCNPFTLGHRYLVEYACAVCDAVHVFVVEEDRSLFPTSARLKMVKNGVADLDRARVHLSGKYMISAATFPKYFLKEGEDAAALQSALDVEIFRSRIAPLLNITKRFAGQEPTDRVTARYNAEMKRKLPERGIDFVEIPRIEWEGQVVSASQVRKLLEQGGRMDEIRKLVPYSTWSYLAEEWNAH